MVKGVNKTIIEISNTGSKYFDKVLLFVNPAHISVPQKRLENKALEILAAAETPSVYSAVKKEKKGISPLWLLLPTLSAVAFGVLAFII